MTETPDTDRTRAGHPNGGRSEPTGSTEDPGHRDTGEVDAGEVDAGEVEAEARRTRRWQTAAAIGAILAIMIYMLIQGYFGAPNHIPGTH